MTDIYMIKELIIILKEDDSPLNFNRFIYTNSMGNEEIFLRIDYINSIK